VTRTSLEREIHQLRRKLSMTDADMLRAVQLSTGETLGGALSVEQLTALHSLLTDLLRVSRPIRQPGQPARLPNPALALAKVKREWSQSLNMGRPVKRKTRSDKINPGRRRPKPPSHILCACGCGLYTTGAEYRRGHYRRGKALPTPRRIGDLERAKAIMKRRCPGCKVDLAESPHAVWCKRRLK
jgi:hypothetical protein